MASMTLKTLVLGLVLGGVALGTMDAAGAAVRAVPSPIVLGETLTPEQVGALTTGRMPAGATVKVPAGYELPIAVAVRGDLAATVEPVAPVKVKARRDFWLRFTGDDVHASLDGVTYKPVTEVIGGTISFSLSSHEDGSSVQGKLEAEIRVKGGNL